MTWTYSGNPAASDRDAVRFMIGDTDTSSQLASDEEIAYALAEEGSTYSAAARIARALANKYARFADQSVGDLSISYSQRYQQFNEMAKRLELDSAEDGVPFAGGISVADKATREEDSDRVAPAIKVGIHDDV